MNIDNITLDGSTGRIIINDQYVIDVAVEDWSGDEDTYAGEFEVDYPERGVEAWYNEDVECSIDVAVYKQE